VGRERERHRRAYIPPRAGRRAAPTRSLGVVFTIATTATIAITATASGQNLLANGSFESSPDSAPGANCCVTVSTLDPDSDTLAPWSIGDGGVELRGRGPKCPEGGAVGRQWVRLGVGTTGGSVEQIFETRPQRRYVCRFRRWVQSPPGPTVPLQIVGPGFSVLMQLPSDGTECEPPIAASSSVEFDAIGEFSAIRFAYGGGPAIWSVSIDDVVIVPVEDCDGDGIVDGLAIIDGMASDTDGDGVPDACECRGDVDGDGTVDGVELSILLGSWGHAIPETLDADGDGVAGGADLAMLLGMWGRCSR